MWRRQMQSFCPLSFDLLALMEEVVAGVLVWHWAVVPGG